MADTILRGISATGGIRIFVAETTETVRRAQQIHKTYPIATAALGRLLTAGAMMGDMMKGENDRLTLRVAGDGPLGKLIFIVFDLFAMAEGKPRADKQSRYARQIHRAAFIAVGKLSEKTG